MFKGLLAVVVAVAVWASPAAGPLAGRDDTGKLTEQEGEKTAQLLVRSEKP